MLFQKTLSKHFLLLLGVLLVFGTNAQNESTKWYFGYKAALDFMSNPPAQLGNSAMYVTEGCSSIADAGGNLLFYTKGDTVWNKQHQIMANGTGLFGSGSSTQSALIVKKPGSATIYYLFEANGYFGYSIIDMSLAAGNGSVTVKNVSLSPSPNATEKIAGTRHCNGTDVWIVTRKSIGNNLPSDFYAYLLTASGVNTAPVISTAGPNVSSTAAGAMKISLNGKRLVNAVLSNGNKSGFELYDFDNGTGVVSNYLNLISNLSPASYGCEFSPDGSKVYGSTNGYNLFQWDLCAGSGTAIVASQYSYSLPAIASVAALQLAPNGKIYVAQLFHNYLGVINSPNLSGAAVGYVDQGLSLGSTLSYFGLPNILPSLIKAPLTFTQDLACNTVSFSPPATYSPGAPSCVTGGNTVSSVSWNFGEPSSGPNNTSALANPSHTYAAAGTYTVKLNVTYSNCAPDSIIQTITLVQPTISVNQASVTCNGLGTATVSVAQGNSGGQYSYTWTPTLQNGSVAVNLSTGIYTVSVKAQGGSCVSTHTAAIATPSAVQAAVTSSSSCTTGTGAVAVSGGSGNYTYLWSPGSYSSAVVSGLNPGVYTVTVSDAANQCSLSKTLQITTLPLPTLALTGNFTICPGQSATLTANGADTYSWSNNASTSVIIVSPTVNTTYTLTGIKNISQCASSTVVTVVASKCLGLQTGNNEPSELNIFPNPAYGVLYLDFNRDIKADVLTLLFYDCSGKQAAHILCTKTEKDAVIKVDVKKAGLVPGIYFLQCSGTGINITKKISLFEE